MTVGDLVRPRGAHDPPYTGFPSASLASDVGVVVEVRHTTARQPDYRTPTALLVFFPHLSRKKKWFHKHELEMVSESR